VIPCPILGSLWLAQHTVLEESHGKRWLDKFTRNRPTNICTTDAPACAAAAACAKLGKNGQPQNKRCI